VHALCAGGMPYRETMRNPFERVIETVLWRSRFLVLLAVVASLGAAVTIFWITAVDMFYAVVHLAGYADPSLADEVRKSMRDAAVTHAVEVVDGFLLASVMLIFALGLYELFISDIDAAHGSRASSKILVIDSLDDLKTKLAKVILMILIVRLFEDAVKIRPEHMLELVYIGGAIALIGLALYLSHASEEQRGDDKTEPARKHRPTAAPTDH